MSPATSTPALCPDCGAAVLSVVMLGGARFALVEVEQIDGLDYNGAGQRFRPLHRCGTVIRISAVGQIEIEPGGPARAEQLAELRDVFNRHQGGSGAGPTSPPPIKEIPPRHALSQPLLDAARTIAAEEDVALLAKLEAAWVKPVTPAEAVEIAGALDRAGDTGGPLRDGIPYAGHADKPLHREPGFVDTDERPLAERMPQGTAVMVPRRNGRPQAARAMEAQDERKGSKPPTRRSRGRK